MSHSTIHGLHHLQIALPAGGEEAARRFYRDLLGLAEVPVPASVAHLAAAWFEQGEFRLHLGVDPDFHPAKKGHPAFLVSGLDEIVRRVTAAGYPMVSADVVPGFRRCHIYDPAGNRLELIEPDPTAGRK
jgi:catechol 2,3-dioxygenase-like lactoylglutathione lyase family enzyme